MVFLSLHCWRLSIDLDTTTSPFVLAHPGSLPRNRPVIGRFGQICTTVLLGDLKGEHFWKEKDGAIDK